METVWSRWHHRILRFVHYILAIFLVRIWVDVDVYNIVPIINLNFEHFSSNHTSKLTFKGSLERRGENQLFRYPIFYSLRLGMQNTGRQLTKHSKMRFQQIHQDAGQSLFARPLAFVGITIAIEVVLAAASVLVVYLDLFVLCRRRRRPIQHTTLH